jgi:hypothetical protein
MGSGAILFLLVTTLLLASQQVAGSSRRRPITIVHVVADGEYLSGPGRPALPATHLPPASY